MIALGEILAWPCLERGGVRVTSRVSTDGNSRPIMFVARDVEVSPVVATNRGEGTIRALKYAKDSRHNNIVNIISAFALVRGHSSNHREKHRARYSVQRAPRC